MYVLRWNGGYIGRGDYTSIKRTFFSASCAGQQQVHTATRGCCLRCTACGSAHLHAVSRAAIRSLLNPHHHRMAVRQGFFLGNRARESAMQIITTKPNQIAKSDLGTYHTYITVQNSLRVLVVVSVVLGPVRRRPRYDFLGGPPCQWTIKCVCAYSPFA